MSSIPARIGNYSVVSRLGSGGMGTVYLGRDLELDRPVAIKVLRDEIRDEEVLGRFFREARAAAALRHPNIITIYASGQHEFQPFIAMEHVDGTSLADVIRLRRPLSVADKISYIDQICAGLHFAHRAGIIHRDVKPANLMVDHDGVIRILDFGIARVEGSGMTRDGMMMGTLNYMSPEQMLGRPVDHRSDIFAVGAVAYELLAYQQAFKGGLNDGLLQRLPNEPPPPLSDLCSGIPEALERVVARALEKSPDNRFANLAEMRTALAAVREQLDVDASLATVVVRPGAGSTTPPATARPALTDAAAATVATRRTVHAPDAASAPGVVAAPQPSASGIPAAPRRSTAIWIAAAIVVLSLAAIPFVIRRNATAATPTDISSTSSLTEPLSQPVSASSADSTATQPTPAPEAPTAARRAPVTTAAPSPILPTVTPPVSPAANSTAPGAITSPGPSAELQDLLARVRTMYNSGDLAGALDILAQHPDAASESAVQDVSARIANAAFDAMRSAERDAQARNASELAGEALRVAADARGRAEGARQRSAMVDAGVQALLARDAYQQAAAQAIAKRNQPPAAAPAAVAPVSTATAVVSPQDALERERGGIVAALGRFQAAYRDRDINELLQVFPSLQREARQSLERAFRECRAYDVGFGEMEVLVNPADATAAQVTVQSTYSCTVRTGQRPQVAAQRDVFVLRKRAGTWIIERTGSVN